MWESSREFSRAVESFLQVTPAAGFDAATSTAAWSSALQIAAQHDRRYFKTKTTTTPPPLPPPTQPNLTHIPLTPCTPLP